MRYPDLFDRRFHSRCLLTLGLFPTDLSIFFKLDSSCFPKLLFFRPRRAYLGHSLTLREGSRVGFNVRSMMSMHPKKDAAPQLLYCNKSSRGARTNCSAFAINGKSGIAISPDT